MGTAGESERREKSPPSGSLKNGRVSKETAAGAERVAVSDMGSAGQSRRRQ